jgi:hypothetical protein
VKRLSLLGLTVVVLSFAAAYSRNQGPPSDGLVVQVEERNPWTHLRLNNDPGEFRFALVSDRTGGHRARVFSQAVEQLNLLQPEFVIAVGDLIEGYTEEPDRLAAEWREFQGYVCQLRMPFFYVAGNHDLTNLYQEKAWKEKFGRRWYSFTYRNVLFLALNTEDPPHEGGGIGPEQLAFIKQALQQNADARWTVVVLHRPLWTQQNLDKNGWLEVEKLLAGRPYTVFCGHIHRYQKFVRQGQNYYQLATTGGGSRMRGVPYGEFDHVAWVTMKKDGPLIANILLDGVYPEDMKRYVSDEAGVPEINRKPCHPVRGVVLLDGCPLAGAQVVFHSVNLETKRTTHAGDALIEPDGTFVLSTYKANDGAPAGDYVVTVTNAGLLEGGTVPTTKHPIPAAYEKPGTAPLRVAVKAGKNQFTFELKK